MKITAFPVEIKSLIKSLIIPLTAAAASLWTSFINSFNTTVFSLKASMFDITFSVVQRITITSNKFTSLLFSNREVVFFSSLAILSVIMVTIVISASVRFTRSFRSYSGIIEDNLSYLGRHLILIFKKESYSSSLITLMTLVSKGIYSILIFIWESTVEINFIHHPEATIQYWKERSALLKKYTSPFVKTIQALLSLVGISKKAGDEDRKKFTMDMFDGLESDEKIPESIAVMFQRDSGFMEGMVSDEFKSTMHKVVERWESGRDSSLLIKGGEGSGKTALMNYIASNYNYPSTYLRVYRDRDFFSEEIISNIDSIEKQIIMVDDLELLFERKINGFTNLAKFLILVSGTDRRVLWVVSANRFFCDFIEMVYPIESYFKFIFAFGGFTPEFIAGLFKKRLSDAGLDMKVIATKEIYRDIKIRIKQKIISYSQVEDYLISLFFQKCYDMGRTNHLFYSFIFKSSIHSVSDNIIYLKFPEPVDLSFVGDYDIEALFILQTLFIHKTLTIEKISSILLMPPERVSMYISLLIDNALVSSREEGFTIFSNVYYQLVKIMETKNLL